MQKHEPEFFAINEKIDGRGHGRHDEKAVGATAVYTISAILRAEHTVTLMRPGPVAPGLADLGRRTGSEEFVAQRAQFHARFLDRSIRADFDPQDQGAAQAGSCFQGLW